MSSLNLILAFFVFAAFGPLLALDLWSERSLDSWPYIDSLPLLLCLVMPSHPISRCLPIIADSQSKNQNASALSLKPCKIPVTFNYIWSLWIGNPFVNTVFPKRRGKWFSLRRFGGFSHFRLSSAWKWINKSTTRKERTTQIMPTTKAKTSKKTRKRATKENSINGGKKQIGWDATKYQEGVNWRQFFCFKAIASISILALRVH